LALDRIASRLGVHLDAETRERVASEQLKMVWSHASVGTIMATAFAVLMAYQFGAITNPTLVQAWVAAKVAVALMRLAQAHLIRTSGYPATRSWRLWTYYLLAADGVIWGLCGLWLTGMDRMTAALAIASLGCVAAIAMFGLQVDKWAANAYVAPIMSLVIVGALDRGDAFGAYCGTGLSLFLATLVITAKRSDAQSSENLLLRIHAARVSAEKARALELAQRQSAVKSQFLGTVSHELRTPIHGMLGVARLVHVESHDALIRRRMELIEASGTHLLGLVTDLIDVSRIESNEMRIQRLVFDLAAEVHRVADIYSVRATEKGLAFTLDSQLPTPHWVIGDPARTRQVLHNLLGNAIKFTHQGWVGLVVRHFPENRQATFEVKDTGIGISEQDQHIVFNAFQQVSASASGRREGTGLGLTIAHEIAKLLGGQIELKSRLGFGSSFTFTASFEPAPSQPPEFSESAGASDPAEMGPARILLVEDNDVNALIASSMLANQGHKVERACDGAEAVRRALRDIDRPDLVLMDCMMPVMDGFDATRSIRAQEAALGIARVPIIALSAIIDDEVEQRTLAVGMDGALGKPFSSEDLRQVMRPWLRGKGAHTAPAEL
jgi:signal transduction histidine kinase